MVERGKDMENPQFQQRKAGQLLFITSLNEYAFFFFFFWSEFFDQKRSFIEQKRLTISF